MRVYHYIYIYSERSYREEEGQHHQIGLLRFLFIFQCLYFMNCSEDSLVDETS